MDANIVFPHLIKGFCLFFYNGNSQVFILPKNTLFSVDRMKKLFYHFIVVVLKVYNRFYFRRFKVYGLENIPNEGSVLFSPNHQNAFLDPLLVGTTCGKSLHSLTRSDVFGGPYQWFLDALQTLPVYRIRDGYEQLKKNDAIFNRCHKLLGTGNSMMMFSEGQHHPEYYLQPLSKGSSRLGMEAQLKSPETPIYIQAVGLNFGHHLHPYHDVHIVYGKPILLQAYLEEYKKNAPRTLNKIRASLQEQMKACLWLPENDESYRVKKIYINGQNSHLEFKTFKTALANNDSRLKVKKQARSFVPGLKAILNLFNSLPLAAINQIMKKFKDPVFHGSVNYLIGLVIFLIWWVIIGFIGYFLGGLIISISLIFISLILLYSKQLLIVKYL